MNYSQKLQELKKLEEENRELADIVSALYEEIAGEKKDDEKEDVEELKKMGWKHKEHNPWSEPPSRGYYINEPHPKHKGWYKPSGPYYGD